MPRRQFQMDRGQLQAADLGKEKRSNRRDPGRARAFSATETNRGWKLEIHQWCPVQFSKRKP